MPDRPIVIADSTARLLRSLLANRATTPHDQEHLHDLSAELDRALVLATDAVPPNVVTLHSSVWLLDLESGERQKVMLVRPEQADVRAGRISVVAPLGTALLGYRETDEIEWLMPGGLRRFRIERVEQKPGDSRGKTSASELERADAN